VAHAIGVSIAVIIAWGFWKSLASALLYIDVSLCGRLQKLSFSSVTFPRASILMKHLSFAEQAPPTAVSSPIDLSDALEALLEFDD
jgi:hypothetical protein